MIKVRTLFDFLNIFVLSFCVICTSAFKNGNFITEYSNQIIAVGLVLLLCMQLAYNSYSLNEYLIILCLFLLATIIMYNSQSLKVTFLFLYILSSSYMTTREALRNFLISKFIVLFTTIALFMFGFLEDLNNNEFGRHSYGFGQANTLGATVMIIEIILFLNIILDDSKKKMINSLIYLGLWNIPMFYLLISSGSSGSLGAIVIAFLLLCLNFASHKKFLKSNFNKVLTVCSIWGIPVISYIFLNSSVDQIGTFLNKLNNLFTNRLHLSLIFFKNYGISFLGQPINYNFNLNTFNYYAFIDNAYIELGIRYGMASLFIILLYVYSIFKKSLKINEEYILILIVVMGCYGFVEQGFDEFWVNPVFSLAGIFMVKENKEKIFLSPSSHT